MPWLIQKDFSFEAAHHLPLHDGKCRSPHGHSYIGYIRILGLSLIAQGPKTGMVMDSGDLSETIKPVIKRYLAHQDLNERLVDVSATTAEEIAKWLYEFIKPKLPAGTVFSVGLKETASSMCIYSESMHGLSL